MGDELENHPGGLLSKVRTSRRGKSASLPEEENPGRNIASASAMRCSWNVLGDTCGRAASISTGTLGGGPWYCRDHYADLTKTSRWTVASDSDPQSAVDMRVNKLIPRWNGESEHAWSMRCKDWALARLGKPLAQFEPGELG